MRMNANTIWPLVVYDDGSCTIPDEVLIMVYYRLCEEGRYDSLFYDGAVTDVHQWLAFIKSRERLPLLVVNPQKGSIHCIAWLSDYSRGTPFVHFCLLGKHWRGVFPVILEYWKQFNFHVLLGITPETNTQALRIVRFAGFREIGTIPKVCPIAKTGQRVGGVLTCYEYI